MEKMEINARVKTDMFKIDPRNIVVVDGFNSRSDFDLDELVESIKVNGVLNPVTVIFIKDENGNEKYQLVDGERRYRATMKAIADGVDIPRIPAIKIPRGQEEDLIIQQIVRNEGKPFNEYEYGVACQKLINKGFTIAQISQKLGKCAGQIQYFVEHLDRDEKVQKLLANGTISGSEVRRVYHAHKNADGVIDEKSAVEEILNAGKKAAESGKKKITTKDMEGKTQSVKRSEAILKGLTLLFDAYDKYSSNGTIKLGLNPRTIMEELKKKRTIDEIFSEKLAEITGAVKEAV